MCELANHIARYRMKEIASFGMTTNVIASPVSSTTRPRWRTRYRASPHVTAVYAYGWLAQSTLEAVSVDPYGLVTFTGGGTAELHYGAATVENANPDHCAVVHGFALSAGSFWSPTADTVYSVTVSDEQSRLVALTIYEVGVNLVEPFDTGFAAGTPILDTDRSDLVLGARLLWKRQAAPLFTWTVDDQASPRTRTSATPINIIDNASTAVSTATVGYTLDLRRRSTIRRTTVPCVLEAYISTDSGAGDVKLKDDTGAVVAEVSNSGAAQWVTVTANLPATRAKYDLHYNGNGGNVASVMAVSLRQYSSGT